jgi:hypothetical protein
MAKSNIDNNSIHNAVDLAFGFFVKQLSEEVISWGSTPSTNAKPCPWTTAQIIDSLMLNGSIHEPHVKKASDWLVQQQNYDGSWGSVAYGTLGDVPATACCTVVLFEVHGKTSIAALKGCDWLCRTFNQGWTTQPTLEKQRFQPFHPYSTAYALRALVRSPREPINSLCIQEGVTILLRSQRPEGGWGFQPDLLPDPTFTCYVLHGLFDVRDIWGLPISHDVVYKAIKWLVGEQNQNGSWREWHGVPESPEATGYSVYVILRSGLEVDDTVIDNAIEWLLRNRDPTGGWMLNPMQDNEPNNWVTHSVLLGLNAYQLLKEPKLEERVNISALIRQKKTQDQIMYEWLRSRKEQLSYIGKRFSGYRSDFGDPEITWKDIMNWLLQFSVENLYQSRTRIELALKLLENVRYINKLQITTGIIKMLESIQPELPSPSFVCPFGGPKDSSANYFYPLDKMRKTMKLPLVSLRDALNSTSRPEALIFIDDVLISGTQAHQMLEEMILGTRTNGHSAEYYLTPLTGDELEVLRSIKIIYIPYLADLEGVRKVEAYARSAKFNLDLTIRPYFMENSRCFDLGEVFSDINERMMAQDMAQEIGYELLSEIAREKGWTDEVRLQFSLGYGGFQKLIVLDRNIPKVSLPILWCEGHWRGKMWHPLFKRA